MQLSQVVLSYLRVLIWPALLGALAIGFRSTIRSLLGVRLRQIDAAGISAKFEEAAQEAERVVQADSPERPDRPTKQLNWGDVEILYPRSYADASKIGAAFRNEKPVVIDLNGLNDPDSRRLVDFSAGLVVMGRGTLYRLRDKVFSLTPAAFLDD